jgi:FkbM family methyltransferase
MIKNAVKRLIETSVTLAGRTVPGRYFYQQVVSSAMGRTQAASHGGQDLLFAVPNDLNKYRASTFSTKEPETLEWIDKMPAGATLWDIGANVGLYSCYAARARDCRVFAFEPSVFNLELLARNIFLNRVTGRVTIVPLPLSGELAFSTLKMTTTDWGGALSTFGKDYGHDGLRIAEVFEFPTVGLSMVDAVRRLGIPQPDFIKMDVDGIEHLILQGGAEVLRAIKGILIEINDKFEEQANEASRYLREAGLALQAKRHADCFDHVEGAARHTYNQIWARPA